MKSSTETRSTSKSFLRGAAILGIAGLICKIIGAVYRIPLTNIIGEEAMGIYSKVYQIYTLLLVLSTSGLPTAISKLVAERYAMNDPRGAESIFKLARNILLTFGGICMSLMMLFSGLIADSLGISEGAFVVICIAPSLILSVMSSYYGYFQGMQLMMPSATSQVVGQVGKLLFGFTFAILWMPKGPTMAAAGALLGVTLSEFGSLVYIYTVYRFKYKALKAQIDAAPRKIHVMRKREMLKQLFRISVPITIGGAIIPLVNMIDSYLVTWCLLALDYGREHINSMYGVLNGMVSSLVNMPAVLTVAISSSLVPAVSRAITERKGQQVSKMTSTGLKLALIIGLPACAGLFMMAKPILSLLYGTSSADKFTTWQIAFPSAFGYNFVFTKLELGEILLQIMSFGVLFISIVQAMTGALQGVGKILMPIRNLFIGGVCKVLVNVVLISIPGINIKGAPVGTVVCYGVTTILNVICAIKYCNLRISIKDMILRPLLATGIMVFVIKVMQQVLGARLQSRGVTLLVIATAGGAYIIALLLVRAFEKEDFGLVPGGEKIYNLLERIGVYKKELPKKEETAFGKTHRNRERIG